MRCEVCGRPYDGEALLPREIACCGCHAEYLAFQAEITPEVPARKDADGNLFAAIPAHLTYTDEQALAMARQKHYAREETAHDALILSRYEANAAGKTADGSGPIVGLTAAEMTAIKAHAADMVASLKRAVE